MAGYPQLRNEALLEIPTYLDRVALWGSFSKSRDEKKNVVAKSGLRRVLEKGEKKGRGGESKGPWFDIRI